MSLGTKNRILCLTLALSLLLTLISCGRVDQLLSSTHKDALIINEVVTSNQLSLQDEVYDHRQRGSPAKGVPAAESGFGARRVLSPVCKQKGRAQ